jgi:hypothetical protein
MFGIESSHKYVVRYEDWRDHLARHILDVFFLFYNMATGKLLLLLSHC